MLGWILGGAILLFLAVILIRTALFQPKAPLSTDNTPVSFPEDTAVNALASLIRCKTVSNIDPTLEDDAEFEKLIALLPTLYPRVFDVCSYNRLPDRALLLRWPGKSEKDPSVMMAHYDVVPVEETHWESLLLKGSFPMVFCGAGVLWTPK